MRFGFLVLGMLLIGAAFGGCSEKQMNDNVDSISNDISNFGKKVTEEH